MSRGLVVDLYAGGGGASTGIEAALGRPVDVALNHDEIAIAVHRANHPDTRHFLADVWSVAPRKATGGRPVDLLWASPDCTHFSIAKGAKPRQQKIRSLAWAVVRWAADVRPAVICLENVPEFGTWGPLVDGRPVKARMGATFLRWRRSLERLGYRVDHRILDASRYGAPTRRRRLFIVARRDGLIRWPDATHGAGLLPLRTAAECIDWSIPCPSIFERSRPLAEKTLWRIAEGLRRFVFDSPEPFLVETGNGERRGQDARVRSIRRPLWTTTATGSQGALVSAFLTKHFGGVVGTGLDRAIGTITARDHHALTAATLIKLRGECHGSDLRAPMPTITASGLHVAEVRAFLTAFYSSGSVGQRCDRPLRTVTAKHRLGLVTVEGVEHQIGDIGLRMLEPEELLRAQFGRFADAYDLSAATTKAGKIRLIGNSVAPEVAEALVRANFESAEAVA